MHPEILVLLHPVVFYDMEASMLFCILWPTILCVVEDTAHHMNTNKAERAQALDSLLDRMTDTALTD